MYSILIIGKLLELLRHRNNITPVQNKAAVKNILLRTYQFFVRFTREQ